MFCSQIQADGATKKYAGPVDCAKQLFREGGIRSVYRGTCATLLRGEMSVVLVVTFIRKQLLEHV